MKKKLTPKAIWGLIKGAGSCFVENKVLKLSAALAYYTVFSLGPMMIVIIFLADLFYGREAVEGSIYGQLSGLLGSEAALQIQETIKNSALSNKSSLMAVIGFVTLLLGATSVFAEIQDSINMIWGLKAKPQKKAWVILIKNRLLSFGVIASLGFLLLVSLAVSGLVDALSTRLQAYFHNVAVVTFYIINLIITFGVIATLFAVIFRVLPDAKIKWKDVMAGAIATAVLFMLGKFAISFYISKSNVGSTYGTAGSLVILLVWIYYSSVILYFGAEFTKAYAIKYGDSIRPTDYAVVTKTIDVDEGNKSVQQVHDEKQEK